MQNFADRLAQAVIDKKTPALVGLDPRLDSLPDSIRPTDPNPSPETVAEAFRRFCRGVIDVVAPLVPAVKPQAAFFEQYGPAAMAALADVIAYAQEKGLVVVFDGKRNDIGSTATAYAQGILGREGQSVWGADSLTVSPYLGDDSISPFVDVAKARGAGIFVLVKTSNPGGAMFQDLTAEGQPIYDHVAKFVETQAVETVGECGYGVVGAVVGATYPAQLAELREKMPHAWLLVPGFGSQGGTAADVAAAFDQRGLGAIINNSRGIIFAYTKSPFDTQFGHARWQEAVEASTVRMIEQLKESTPAGRLAE